MLGPRKKGSVANDPWDYYDDDRVPGEGGVSPYYDDDWDDLDRWRENPGHDYYD